MRPKTATKPPPELTLYLSILPSSPFAEWCLGPLLLCAKCVERTDAGGGAGGQIRRHTGDPEDHGSRHYERERIDRSHAKQETRDQSRSHQRDKQPERQPNRGQ